MASNREMGRAGRETGRVVLSQPVPGPSAGPQGDVGQLVRASRRGRHRVDYTAIAEPRAQAGVVAKARGVHVPLAIIRLDHFAAPARRELVLVAPGAARVAMVEAWDVRFAC